MKSVSKRAIAAMIAAGFLLSGCIAVAAAGAVGGAAIGATGAVVGGAVDMVTTSQAEKDKKDAKKYREEHKHDQ
jgi:predicted phage tail protein